MSVDEIDGHAYFAIAVVDQMETRPQWLPARVGVRMSLIEYLVFTSYVSPTGHRLAGLSLVHSETDSRLAAALGHVLSPYRFDRVDLERFVGNDTVRINSRRGGLAIEARRSVEAQVPLGGLGRPRSFNFVDRGPDQGVMINRGILKGWSPLPLNVDKASSSWMDSRDVAVVGEPRGLIVEDVRYLFKRHRIERAK